MSDDKNLRGGQDRSRVAGLEDYEVRHIAEKFGISAEEVRWIIERVGNSREKIEEELKGKKSGR